MRDDYADDEEGGRGGGTRGGGLDLGMLVPPDGFSFPFNMIYGVILHCTVPS